MPLPLLKRPVGAYRLAHKICMSCVWDMPCGMELQLNPGMIVRDFMDSCDVCQTLQLVRYCKVTDLLTIPKRK